MPDDLVSLTQCQLNLTIYKWIRLTTSQNICQNLSVSWCSRLVVNHYISIWHRGYFIVSFHENISVLIEYSLSDDSDLYGLTDSQIQ